MNKDEVIQALEEGKKVTHELFNDEEWVKITGLMYEFEDGGMCPPEEFWDDRDESFWQVGWFIFSEFNKLTDEQVKKYLESPSSCPKCGKSDDFESVGHVDIESGGAYQDVICNDCGFEGTDHYQLVKIEGKA